jgi:phospholipid/cholesterol/gamma-HCH transport system substrate-binding protein
VENRAYALAAGLFVVGLVALLITAALWLSGGPRGGAPYDLITPRSVAGLAPGAPVRLHGVEVGQVESIRFDPLDRRLVRVRVRISPDALLMQDSWAHLASLGISGTPYIELGYPDGSSIVLQTSESEPARIALTPTGLAQLSDSSGELLRSLQGTLARVNAILTPENAAQLSQLLAESHKAASQIRVLSEQLTPAARDAGGLVARGRVVLETTHRTVEHADELLLAVRARGGTLDTLREDAEGARELEQTLLRDTLPELAELAQRLQRNSDTLEQLLREVRDRPQSVLFGAPPGAPGPGEPGFSAPRP